MKKTIQKIISLQKKAKLGKTHENFHRAIVENIYDYSVFTTDVKGVIESWNTGSEKLFGYTEKEVLGKNCSLVFKPEDQKNNIPQKELDNALKKSRAVDERYMLRKDGSQFWASGIVFPVEDVKHVHNGYIKILHDLSDQKDIEDRKDDFISTATHEIRTPITSMKLFADIVKNKTKDIDSTSLNDSVIGLNDQIDRLIALTNYLLDVSKIQSGKLVLKKTFFDLNKLIQSLIVSMRFTSSKHILLNHGSLGQKINADKERISQVITNLISNAIKYSPKGGEIIISTKEQKNSVMVSVQDFGLGISKSEQHKIFTRFFRADVARKTNITGIGLGLYIARKIIHGHQGVMGMKSIKDEGSIFYFTIPIKT